jgi:hypothetical protein
MEGKKAKVELPALEKEILEMCLFVESFSSIADECEFTKDPNIVADGIKNLIHMKFLVPQNDDNSLTWIYDGDKMKDSYFKATALGVEWMEAD